MTTTVPKLTYSSSKPIPHANAYHHAAAATPAAPALFHGFAGGGSGGANGGVSSVADLRLRLDDPSLSAFDRGGLGKLFARQPSTAPPLSHASPLPLRPSSYSSRGEATGIAAALATQPPLTALNLPETMQRYGSRSIAAAAAFTEHPSTATSATSEMSGMDDREESESHMWETSSGSTVSMPPLPSDDTPLVPIDVLRSCTVPIAWQCHPSAPIVLSLLNARGVFLPAHKEMVGYHMAPGFLKAIQHLQLGSYFIKYGLRRSAPKERFFSIRMLENSLGHTIPYLVWSIHQKAMQLIDKAPLTQLVGITLGTGEEAFQRYLLTGSIIKGCRQGPHHAKLPTHGAFTLWFFDQRKQAANSLSLLTCSPTVFDLWKSALEAIIAVNSVCIRELVSIEQTTATPQQQKYAAQQAQGGQHQYSSLESVDFLLDRAQRQVRGRMGMDDSSDSDRD